MFDGTRGNLFSRIRELTRPKAERQETRAERRERESERLAAKRAAAVHAESHSRHSGGFHQEWRG
jgi:hypothetical protein